MKLNETRLSSVIFHCSRSIFGQIIDNFAVKMLFSSCGMVCVVMDDRNYHRIFGRLLINKEKELKEHIEKTYSELCFENSNRKEIKYLRFRRI